MAQPVVLQYAGDISAKMCAQASHISRDAQITLQPIDYTCNTPYQLFNFGQDGRIYPSGHVGLNYCLTFLGKSQNGSPVVIKKYDYHDQKQVWTWNNLNLKNIGASGSTVYRMDNSNGITPSNNPIQLYWANTGAAQYWVPLFPQVIAPQLSGISPPVVLQYAGDMGVQMCAQAGSISSNAKITLQPIDYTGKTLLQQFQFDSDGRIYAAGSPAGNRLCLTYQGQAQNWTPLILAPANLQDKTQMWAWQNGINLENVGASGSTVYRMDNSNSITPSNNPIQLYWANTTGAQCWVPLLVQAMVP